MIIMLDIVLELDYVSVYLVFLSSNKQELFELNSPVLN